MTPRWLGRDTVRAPYTMICLSAAEFQRVARSLKVEDPGIWKTDAQAACVHTWESDGRICCIVCFDPDAEQLMREYVRRMAGRA